MQGRDLACFEFYVVNFFVDPALSDWAAARLLYQNQLLRNFSWAAAQALEKSIKAALLLNWKSAKFNHKFCDRFKELIELRNAAWPDELPQTFPCFDWVTGQKENFAKALDRFERNGSPSARYMLGDIEVLHDDLFRLDFLMKHILLHCHDVDGVINENVSNDRVEAAPNTSNPLVDYFIRKLEGDSNRQSLFIAFTAHNYALKSWSKSETFKLVSATSLGRDDPKVNQSWRAQRYLESQSKVSFKKGM